MNYYRLKAYERITNKIFVSSKLFSIFAANQALAELMQHVDIACVFLKFGTKQTKYVIQPKQQKRNRSICYVRSDGKKIYGISITEYLNNPNYKAFIDNI